MEISQLEPREVFRFFEEISRIPRGSGNTDAISAYCVSFAEERGLRAVKDPCGNVRIWKPGTKGKENNAPVILQGHLDMVCEKEETCVHDFQKDPLKLYVKEGFLKARGTTLGADDGIAVAYILALLDSKEIPHPPLEILLTIDEETGMDGASAADLSGFSGSMLLNLDSEDEGILTVGCAGGFTFEIEQSIEEEELEGEEIEIVIAGLQGGHSGTEISKHLANANKLAGRLILEMTEKIQARLLYINGGGKTNVIPSVCRVGFLLPNHRTEKSDDFCFESTSEPENAKQLTEKLQESWKRIYGQTEPELRVKLFEKGWQKKKGISRESTKTATALIHLCPDGVFSYSHHLEGQVEASNNLGIIRTETGKIRYQMLARSSERFLAEELKGILIRLAECVEKTNVSWKISGEYPAWEYKEESKLRDIAKNAYRELYGKDPIVETIHAGLECGILIGKKPELDCISMGPQMYDVHSARERLEIASVERTWEYLKKILKYI